MILYDNSVISLLDYYIINSYHNYTLTSVCTMKHRLLRILLTNPNTSTFPSALILCSCVKIVIKVPVLPTPALQCTTTGPSFRGSSCITFHTKCSSWAGYSGTPWSGHTVKWNCRTILSALLPSLCKEKVLTVYSASTSTSWMWIVKDSWTKLLFVSSGQYLWHLVCNYWWW